MIFAGEADSGASALQQLETLAPDLILMDIQMPGENGIETTRRIVQKYPGRAVLMLTMFEDDQSVFAAMRAGAVGYVLKGINHKDMLQTLRVAATGGAVFSPAIARQMMQWFAQLLAGAPPNGVQPPMLTLREHEVLALLAQGADNTTIAEMMSITPKSARNYVSQVLKKLAADDRAAVTYQAQQAGLGRKQQPGP